MSHSVSSSSLKALPGKRILILGDVLLDEYIWGHVQRISPEAPVPVVEIARRTYRPGGAANAAANVVSLGGQALLAGVVGRDSEADKLREALAQGGIQATGLVVDSQRVTTTKSRLIAHSQQIVRIDAEYRAALPSTLEDSLLTFAKQQLANVDACILSDYGKGVVSPRVAEQFIAAARSANKPVVVDPKGTNYVKYRGATAIKPNVHEVERFLKQEISDDVALLSAAADLMDTLEGTALLITRGAQGMSLFRRDCKPVHTPAMARNVFDVTGAGDTVVGTLAVALAAGMLLDEAVQLANIAAGIVVGKIGTATVSLDELKDAI